MLRIPGIFWIKFLAGLIGDHLLGERSILSLAAKGDVLVIKEASDTFSPEAPVCFLVTANKASGITGRDIMPMHRIPDRIFIKRDPFVFAIHRGKTFFFHDHPIAPGSSVIGTDTIHGLTGIIGFT